MGCPASASRRSVAVLDGALAPHATEPAVNFSAKGKKLPTRFTPEQHTWIEDRYLAAGFTWDMTVRNEDLEDL